MLTGAMAYVRQQSAAAHSRKFLVYWVTWTLPGLCFFSSFSSINLQILWKMKSMFRGRKKTTIGALLSQVYVWNWILVLHFSNEDLLYLVDTGFESQGLGSYDSMRGHVGVLQRRGQIIFIMQGIQRYISIWFLFIFCCKRHRMPSMLSMLLTCYNYWKWFTSIFLWLDVVGWPWLDTRLPPNPLYHSPL